MKILFLCKKFPYPLKDGESIAVSSLCRELKNMGADITLLCLNTSKHYTNPAALPPEYNYFSAIHTVDLDNSIKPWKAFTSFVSGESYHIRRFKSALFTTKLIEILKQEKFDIIQLETLYLAPYVSTIREYSDAKVVMRAHNVEHEIWERITQNTSSNLKKWYLNLLTRQLREYEIGQFPVYDYLVTLTDRDLQLFRKKGYTNGASAAPIGLDITGYPYTQPQFGPEMSICFIGSLDWMPNLEGLEWFLANVWPKINQRWPKVSFHIAGRNTPKSLLEIKLKNVTVHGEVEDAGEFLNKHAVMIVPLFSGSGMRVKIVEGMLIGKLIISTTIGKEGIDGEHQKELLVADNVQAFVDAIDFCIKHPDQAGEIAKNAEAKALAQFNPRQVAEHMMGIYEELLSSPQYHHSHLTAQPAKS
ncbi:MAG TPA: glycosyltransferase family 4 protein [Saprospiraceae bacterium]|nr:glycosyltransferase family 4 protein [Saprospiraceae bacterium]